MKKTITQWALCLLAALPMGVLAQDVELPYLIDFSNDGIDISSFTTIDANEDYVEWDFSTDAFNIFSMYADESNDDWLITPSFALEAGKEYQFEFQASTGGEYSPEILSAWLGTDAEADAMTMEVIAETTIDQDEPAILTAKFTPTESGIYYFGIHCTSDPTDCYWTDINYISIKAAAVAAAPAAVDDLTVTAEATGELEATISFKAPTKKLDDSDLSTIESIKIFRGAEQLIKTFDNPTPGEELSYTDELTESGDVTYKVIAYDEEAGAGEQAVATAFVGEDVPSRPTNVTLKVEGDDIVLTWDEAATGWNGKYVNLDKMWYTIYETPDGLTRTLVADNVSGQTYTHAGRASAGTDQAQVAYQIIANNKTNKSGSGSTQTLVAGPAYPLPFTESLAGGELSSKWFLDRTASTAGIFSSSEAKDDDGYAIILRGTAVNDTISFRSGKLAVKDAYEPKLLFYSHIAPEADSELTVNVVKDNEYLYTETIAHTTDWQLQTVDLGAFTNLDYVQIYFDGKFKTDRADIFLDVIEVKEGVTDGIGKLTTGNAPFVVYDLNGRQSTTLRKGLNIVRMADGSTRKVVVK